MAGRRGIDNRWEGNDSSLTPLGNGALWRIELEVSLDGDSTC